MARKLKSNQRWSNRLILLSLSLLCLFTSCNEASQTRTIKLAHGLNVDHPVHKGMLRLGELLTEKSGGKLGVEIYPSQQLGTERQCLELLQIGSLGMTKVSAAVMENFAPKMKVLGLPYIFRDRAHSYQVLDGEIGRRLLVDSEEFWLRGLTFFDAGQRSFYTKTRPIRDPADLSGMKIRVMESPVAINLMNALGAAPTPISWGELYTALQQGIVDGAENNPPSFYTSRHYEVCKYYSLNEHTAVPDILVIGTWVWNSLSEQEQAWLQEAADEATEFQRELWQKAEQEALEAVQAAGVEVIRPDKSNFMEKTKDMLEAFKAEPEVYDLIQQIQSVKQ